MLKGWKNFGHEKYSFSNLCLRTNPSFDKCAGLFVVKFSRKGIDIEVSSNLDKSSCKQINGHSSSSSNSKKEKRKSLLPKDNENNDVNSIIEIDESIKVVNESKLETPVELKSTENSNQNGLDIAHLPDDEVTFKTPKSKKKKRKSEVNQIKEISNEDSVTPTKKKEDLTVETENVTEIVNDSKIKNDIELEPAKPTNDDKMKIEPSDNEVTLKTPKSKKKKRKSEVISKNEELLNADSSDNNQEQQQVTNETENDIVTDSNLKTSVESTDSVLESTKNVQLSDDEISFKTPKSKKKKRKSEVINKSEETLKDVELETPVESESTEISDPSTDKVQVSNDGIISDTPKSKKKKRKSEIIEAPNEVLAEELDSNKEINQLSDDEISFKTPKSKKKKRKSEIQNQNINVDLVTPKKETENDIEDSDLNKSKNIQQSDEEITFKTPKSKKKKRKSEVQDKIIDDSNEDLVTPTKSKKNIMEKIDSSVHNLQQETEIEVNEEPKSSKKKKKSKTDDDESIVELEGHKTPKKNKLETGEEKPKSAKKKRKSEANAIIEDNATSEDVIQVDEDLTKSGKKKKRKSKVFNEDLDIGGFIKSLRN